MGDLLLKGRVGVLADRTGLTTANCVAFRFGVKLPAVNKGKSAIADATVQRTVAHLIVAHLHKRSSILLFADIVENSTDNYNYSTNRVEFCK
ncbi:MAG: hypothetical protein LBL62_00640 [Planctomycetaceae bacterium]|nr:hypothetical protein [Planctomycetaceae bacterium]